jgi:hypothetical protein
MIVLSSYPYPAKKAMYVFGTVPDEPLALPGELRRLFSSTNMIESCFSRADDLCRNVKRWRDANMAWRWAGTVLLEADRGFHRIKGYRQIPLLTEALSKSIDRKQAVAEGQLVIARPQAEFPRQAGQAQFFVHTSTMFVKNVR